VVDLPEAVLQSDLQLVDVFVEGLAVAVAVRVAEREEVVAVSVDLQHSCIQRAQLPIQVRIDLPHHRVQLGLHLGLVNHFLQLARVAGPTIAVRLVVAFALRLITLFTLSIIFTIVLSFAFFFALLFVFLVFLFEAQEFPELVLVVHPAFHPLLEELFAHLLHPQQPLLHAGVETFKQGGRHLGVLQLRFVVPLVNVTLVVVDVLDHVRFFHFYQFQLVERPFLLQNKVCFGFSTQNRVQTFADQKLDIERQFLVDLHVGRNDHVAYRPQREINFSELPLHRLLEFIELGQIGLVVLESDESLVDPLVGSLQGFTGPFDAVEQRLALLAGVERLHGLHFDDIEACVHVD